MCFPTLDIKNEAFFVLSYLLSDKISGIFLILTVPSKRPHVLLSSPYWCSSSLLLLLYVIFFRVRFFFVYSLYPPPINKTPAGSSRQRRHRTAGRVLRVPPRRTCSVSTRWHCFSTPVQPWALKKLLGAKLAPFWSSRTESLSTLAQLLMKNKGRDGAARLVSA